MIKSLTEQNFFNLSAHIREALKILAVPYLLNQEIAEDLLVVAGILTIDAAEMVKNVKSYRVWVRRSKDTWCINSQLREVAISQLEENTLIIKRKVLEVLKRHQPIYNIDTYLASKDYYLQMARLSLSIPENRAEAVDLLRSYFNSAELFNNHESARVISIYIDENLKLEDWRGYPENIWKLFFVRGTYAYRQGDHNTALQYLASVLEKRDTSVDSVQDAVIACYYMGSCYKFIGSPGNAEDVFLSGIQLASTINNENILPAFSQKVRELQFELEAITKN